MDARAPNPSTRDGHMTFGRDVASSFVDPNDPRAVSRVVEDALTSTSTVEAGDFVAIDELRRLLLEMEDQLMLDSQQRSWEQCRDHWRRRVRLLHFSDPDLPRSLSKILLDLEASITVVAQHDAWIDVDRSLWISRVKDVGNPDRDRTPLPYFYWVFRASTHLGSLYDSVKAEAWKSTLGEPWPHTRDGDEWLRRLFRLTDPDASRRALFASEPATHVERHWRAYGSTESRDVEPPPRFHRPRARRPTWLETRNEDSETLARIDFGADDRSRDRTHDRDTSESRSARSPIAALSTLRGDPHYLALVRHYRRAIRSGEVGPDDFERERVRVDPERDALVAAAVDSLSRRRDQTNAAPVDELRGFENTRDESNGTGGPRARRSLLSELATDSEASEEGSGTDVDDDDEEDFGMLPPFAARASPPLPHPHPHPQSQSQSRPADEPSLRAAYDEMKAAFEEAKSDVECQICFTNRRDALIMPCCHLLYCRTCVDRAASHAAARGQPDRCPCCRGSIGGVLICKLSSSE